MWSHLSLIISKLYQSLSWPSKLSMEIELRNYNTKARSLDRIFKKSIKFVNLIQKFLMVFNSFCSFSELCNPLQKFLESSEKGPIENSKWKGRIYVQHHQFLTPAHRIHVKDPSWRKVFPYTWWQKTFKALEVQNFQISSWKKEANGKWWSKKCHFRSLSRTSLNRSHPVRRNRHTRTQLCMFRRSGAVPSRRSQRDPQDQYDHHVEPVTVERHRSRGLWRVNARSDHFRRQPHRADRRQSIERYGRRTTM